MCFNTRKLISVFLSGAMLFSASSLPAFAEETETIAEVVETVEQTETEVEEIGATEENETITETTEETTEVATEEIQLMSENISLMSTGTDYYIRTAEELNNVRNDLAGTYYLMNDIDLSSYGDWVPIGHSNGAFSGTFDGQGYEIKGMTIGNNEYERTGLFGHVSGAISNLGVSGTITTTNNNVGMLAGYASAGAKIKNCYTTGSIEANQNIGGLVGYTYSYRTNYSVTIENCYSKVAVTGLKTGTSDYLGGLIGKDYSTTYYNGDVGTVIKRCYATGYIRPKNDNAHYGGIIGAFTGGSNTLLFCYYDKDTVKAIDTNKGFAATTTQMKTESIFTGWDFDNVWGIDTNINNGYPYLKFGASSYVPVGAGTQASPYIISTQDDLIAITEGKIAGNGVYYELANDIILDAVFWTPIGGNLSNIDFAGYFDGAGHTISGLNITQDNFTYSGLFGKVTGAIVNLAVDGNISVGINNVGMLVGHAYNNAKIKNCYTTGTIEANQNVGGLVGYTYSYRTNYPVTIENCYSQVAVTGLKAGTSDYLGGLVGKDDSTTYYNGDAGTVIKRCYATGYIRPKNDNAHYGGLIGALTGNSNTLLFCYYDRNTVKAIDTNKGFAATTAQMKTESVFTGWDFDNVWGIDANINNGYPYLKFGEYEYENDGSGSKYDPYMIYTQDDLIAITEGKIGKAGSYYELANDIALDAVFWTPIGGNLSNIDFAGYFDGAGHTISGLNISQDNFTYSGLFGKVVGTITNLAVDGNISTSNSNVGMLAGYAYNSSSINNCYTTGSIKANQNVGGLVGYTYSYRTNNPVVIENCYSKVSITGVEINTSDYLGGLIGKDYSTTYYNGDVGTIIKRCYSLGLINADNSAAKNVGGVVGALTGNNYTLLFCYYDKETVKAIDTNKGFAATTAQMKTESVFTGWDFDNVWGIDANINNGYPYLKFGEYEYENDGSGSKYDPYMIYTQDDLIAITEGKIGKAGSYYELANDIALDAVFWTPIGGNLSNIDFAGYFDGAGHTISGLNISQDNFTYSGLFGKVVGTITNLAVDGNISTSNSNVGMLAGYAYNSSSINNCYTTGSIKANQNVGGLIGYTHSYRTSSPVAVENCYSKVKITGLEIGTSDYIGGLVGKDYSTTYYNGDAETSVKCCYATGYISPENSSATHVGGAFGGLTGVSAKITACYYDQPSTGMSDTGKGIPLSTSEMKTQGTFVIWDFDTVWAISSSVNNGYPYLQALIPADTTPVTGISLNKTSISLAVGGSETLVATIIPSNATNQNITWTSSNNNIATVSNGNVTALKAGTAVITATTADGGYTANCNITVTEKVIDENAPKITITDIKTRPGNEIQVTVDLANNTGFASMGIEVGYNSEVMTLTNVTSNSGVGGTFTPGPNYTINPFNLGWDSASNINYNGNLATLTFTVNADAPNGVYPITLDYYKGVNGDYVDGEDINYDENFNAVGFVYISGNVVVASYTPGDLTGDDKVNNKDATYLLRYLAKWDLPDLITEALDIDASGSVNNKDATILLRYLAGWDITLH